MTRERKYRIMHAMNYGWYSYLLVIMQFGLLVAIAATGPLLASNTLFLFVELAGAGLGLWAIAVMRIGSFNVIPDVKEGALLIERGPYRVIRHPMYSSLIVITGALVADSFSWLRFDLWVVLIIVLMAKLSYEERLLTEAFSGYSEYMNRTKRLVPFIF